MYKRLGLERLDCQISNCELGSDTLDNVIIELSYVSEKQLNEAYGLMFYYKDDNVTITAPCSVSYVSGIVTLSFTGYKFKDMLTGNDVRKNGLVMYLKRGLLK